MLVKNLKRLKSDYMEIPSNKFEDEIINSDKPSLIMFWGSWCVVCKREQVLLREISIDNVKIGTVNIDKNPKLSVKYNIMGTPTFILFKGGKEIARIFGSQTKEQLKKFVNDSKLS